MYAKHCWLYRVLSPTVCPSKSLKIICSISYLYSTTLSFRVEKSQLSIQLIWIPSSLFFWKRVGWVRASLSDRIGDIVSWKPKPSRRSSYGIQNAQGRPTLGNWTEPLAAKNAAWNRVSAGNIRRATATRTSRLIRPNIRFQLIHGRSLLQSHSFYYDALIFEAIICICHAFVVEGLEHEALSSWTSYLRSENFCALIGLKTLFQMHLTHAFCSILTCFLSQFLHKSIHYVLAFHYPYKVQFNFFPKFFIPKIVVGFSYTNDAMLV